MERSARNQMIAIFIGIVVFLKIVPAKAEIGSAERFPESRFGSPPAPPVYGMRNRMDGLDEESQGMENGDSRSSRRSPASILGSNLDGPTKGSKTDPRKGLQEVALIAGDLGFFPKTVFVTRDIPVRLFVTGASKKTLCIMLDVFQVRKQVRSQHIEEISFVPTIPGQYRFYCPINGMEGTLFVKELNMGSGVNFKTDYSDNNSLDVNRKLGSIQGE